MKKTLMLLMAATLVLGFAGVSLADVGCTDCITDPGLINRGCVAEQEDCDSAYPSGTPFDFEDCDFEGTNYCQDTGKGKHRYLFPLCDCETALGILGEGDTIDIRLEILVNGKSGDNGAYWAEDVTSSGIGLETYSSDEDPCEQDELCYYPETFNGPFRYLWKDTTSWKEGQPRTTSAALCGDDWADDSDYEEYRVTIIELDTSASCYEFSGHGYGITTENEADDESIWAIDIPHIRFDLNKISAGDVVSVRVCLTKATAVPVTVDNVGDWNCNETVGMTAYEVDYGGICGECGCCCTLVIGTLECCEEPNAGCLVYPYATPMNDANWWYGMVITNLSGNDSEANITVYENDGDTATISVEVPAHSMFVKTGMQLMGLFGGTIGDERAYFKVESDFNMNGFMFIGNDLTGTSMGYLPDCCSKVCSSGSTVIINGLD